MLNKIYETSKYVSDNSKDVCINYKVVDRFISTFQKTSFWLSTNPFNILDMEIRDIINFLLIYHTIGDYSFWGSPKWEIETDKGKMDGSFAIMYLTLKEFKKRGNLEISFEDFKSLLLGNIEIPLLKERYEELTLMNASLDGSNFYDLIKDIVDDETLFSFLISRFPYFEDVRKYEGKDIYFYKRAQLLTSDILHVRESLENIAVDYSHLVGCADYKIPQVMNSLGMLEYSPKLDAKISSLEEIPVDDSCEVEIRANTLIVIDYIMRRLNGKVARIDINDYIWLLGQDKTKIDKPYHRTRTINY